MRLLFSVFIFLNMSSPVEDKDKTLQAKRIFLNYVDSYHGKNFAKVCIKQHGTNF